MTDRIVRLLAPPEDAMAPTVFGGAHCLTEVRQFSLAISRATKRESLTLVNHWGTRSTSDISYSIFFRAWLLVEENRTVFNSPISTPST